MPASPRSESELIERLLGPRYPRPPGLLRRAARDAFLHDYALRVVRKTFFWEYHLANQELGPERSMSDITAGHFGARVLRYPVLRRLLDERYARALKHADELAKHLEQDLEALADTFNAGRPLGQLRSVAWGLSDAHRGARQVHILHFSNTSVVYKPRSLALDSAFAGFSSWLSSELERSGRETLRSMRVLDRGDHGWAEYVEHRPVTDRSRLEAYYFRFGATIGLLYALAAVDIHYENLIAQDGHPILIDLESCLQPKRRALLDHAESGSVMETAMLPTRMWNHEGSVEISALAARDGEALLGTDHVLTGFEEGVLRLEKRARHARGRKNGPDQRNRSPALFQRSLKQGFVAAYQILRARREFLLTDPASPVTSLLRCDARYFARPTMTYFELLNASYHPRLLRDEKTFAAHFEWLAKNPPPGELPASVTRDEIADLASGDIPYFTVSAADGALRARHEWRGVFAATAADNVAYRLRRKMSAADLTRQKWFIDASLALLGDPARSTRVSLPDEPRAIFRRLRALAGTEGERPPLWLTIRERDGRGMIVSMGAAEREELEHMTRVMELYVAHFGDESDREFLRLHRDWLATLGKAAPSKTYAGGVLTPPLLAERLHRALLKRSPELVARELA